MIYLHYKFFSLPLNSALEVSASHLALVPALPWRWSMSSLEAEGVRKGKAVLPEDTGLHCSLLISG